MLTDDKLDYTIAGSNGNAQLKIITGSVTAINALVLELAAIALP